MTLPYTAVQYAPVDPFPGTAYYERLEKMGMLPERELKLLNMSHYNVKHPTLNEEKVLGLIRDFLDLDYETRGPLVYRFLKRRWDGYLCLKDSANPYVRARSEIFRRDAMRGYPVMLLGETFSPGARSQALFSRLRQEVTRHFSRREVLRDLLRGRLGARDGGLYLASSLPVLRELARAALSVNVVLKDPRNGGPLKILSDPAAALRRSGHGTVPWSQPGTVRTQYNLIPSRATAAS